MKSTKISDSISLHYRQLLTNEGDLVQQIIAFNERLSELRSQLIALEKLKDNETFIDQDLGVIIPKIRGERLSHTSHVLLGTADYDRKIESLFHEVEHTTNEIGALEKNIEAASDQLDVLRWEMQAKPHVERFPQFLNNASRVLSALALASIPAFIAMVASNKIHGDELTYAREGIKLGVVNIGLGLAYFVVPLIRHSYDYAKHHIKNLF